jgi:hypothetical protein
MIPVQATHCIREDITTPIHLSVRSYRFASASPTHFLTALCCAHSDISLYLACSFTSARQVVVACLTAASAASAKVASQKLGTHHEAFDAWSLQ